MGNQCINILNSEKNRRPKLTNKLLKTEIEKFKD
jgi:hypothetical protein